MKRLRTGRLLAFSAAAVLLSAAVAGSIRACAVFLSSGRGGMWGGMGNPPPQDLGGAEGPDPGKGEYQGGNQRSVFPPWRAGRRQVGTGTATKPIGTHPQPARARAVSPLLPPTGSGRVIPESAERPAAPEPPKGKDRFRRPVQAMWVWDARVALDPTARARLLAFCRTRGVDTLYLSAYDLRSPLDESYRQFNRIAHEAGLTVHALAGDPRWGKPQYHHLPLEWMEAVRRMNAASSEEERFDGIHTDIEVYLLSKTWKERPEFLLGGYLDLTARMAEALRSDTLWYSVDIPFWFDDDTSYRIFWRGAVKAPSHHVLDVADSVTVMAYRNFAEGSDGTVHLVSLELDYAERIGKRVVIGQETQENLYPSYVTFGGSSAQALHQEVEKMRRALGHRPGFGGFAIHHYESYRKLCGE